MSDQIQLGLHKQEICLEIVPCPTTTMSPGGLNHVLQKNEAPFSVVDKNNHRFHDLIKVMDSLSIDLHRQGGAVKHSAKVNSKCDDVLWQEGLIGYSSPKF